MSFQMTTCNPFVRAKKFCEELKSKKCDDKPLSNTQLAFRSGYTQAMKDFAELNKNASFNIDHGYLERDKSEITFTSYYDSHNFSGDDIL